MNKNESRPALKNLMLLFAWACVAGGAMNAGQTLLYHTAKPSMSVMELVWDATDVFLLTGIIGIYLYRMEDVKWMGMAGFVLGLLGAALLLGPNKYGFGVDTYPMAAASFISGLLIIALAGPRGRWPRWITACWLLAAGLGLPGLLASGMELLHGLGEILFSIAFAGAGLYIRRGLRGERPANRGSYS